MDKQHQYRAAYEEVAGGSSGEGAMTYGPLRGREGGGDFFTPELWMRSTSIGQLGSRSLVCRCIDGSGRRIFTVPWKKNETTVECESGEGPGNRDDNRSGKVRVKHLLATLVIFTRLQTCSWVEIRTRTYTRRIPIGYWVPVGYIFKKMK